MTREELRDAISQTLAVDCMCGIDRADATDDILALFDRYEREQWRSEPPTERQETMLMEVSELGARRLDLWYGYDPGEHWPPHQRYTGRWRKVTLPPGPGEGGGDGPDRAPER